MLRIRFVVTALLILGLADPACPVTSPFPEAPFSMGQPRRITASWGPSFGYVIEDDEFERRLSLSVTGEAFFPQFGFAQLTFEGALAGRSDAPEWLLAGYAKVPWIRAGLEYRSKARDFVPAFSVMVVPRRGGLLGLGDVLRVDYRPHNQTVLLGITIRQPFVRYRRTRPTHEYTRIPRGRVSSKNPALKVFPLTAQLSRRIEEVEHAMLWLDRLLTPCFEFGEDFVPDAGAYRGHIRKQGHTFLEEDATYHQGLSDAFALAVDGDVEQGDILAQKAEAVLLQRVVIPFNRLFGQNKRPHRLGGYTQAALQEFESYLAQERHFSRLDPHIADRQLAHAREIFRRVLRQLDRVSKNSRDRWFQSYLFWLYQSRLVWLPLNYGLRSEQYDTQEEWDRVMEQLTRKRFTHTNDIRYLVNEQFHTEIKRMIKETEAYHILWLHDFRGRHGKGRTDIIGWDLVVDGYIPALIQAILDMDAGCRNTFPQFMIFLDELYYQENRSRQIITFLENIGNHKEIELQDKRVQGRVRVAQRHLLSLAQNSSALASLDRDELRDLLKVHVSVTNPHDPAFTADATIRDHRKITFRDVFERDPGLGEAIFTGKGVGEHYSGSGWEDRSILVRGGPLCSTSRSRLRDSSKARVFVRLNCLPISRGIRFPPITTISVVSFLIGAGTAAYCLS